MAQRFLLLQVITPHYHQETAVANMAELTQLVETYGGIVIEKSVQHRVHPHPGTYIGEGKLSWLLTTVQEKAIDVVVLNDIVNSGQLFRLEKALWKVNTRIAVWDRVDLILNIFEQHATSVEAKLQIELARIQHIGPRVYGLGGTVLSRQGGGIGTRGLGETNTERERRIIRRRTQEIRDEIARRGKLREKVIAKRQRAGMQTVALVGYTSAGKTTLFTALTKKEKEADASLFTTLDTVVGKMKRAGSPSILISDTIGFIDDLPPLLIDAFRSTLQESVQAQQILHVVDAADVQRVEKIIIVEKILAELGVQTVPILVLTKMDTLSAQQVEELHNELSGRQYYCVSSVTGEGIPALKETIFQSMATL